MGPQSDALPQKPIGAMGWLRHSRLTPFLAIIDQALYALTNLVLQIVVARSISSDEYGAFSIGVLFFFVAALVQQALIIEPMFVFSRHRYGERMAAYHNRLKRGWAFGFGLVVVAVGGVLSLGLWSFHLPVVAVSVLGFAIVSPASLYMWLLRRMALLLGQVHLAVIGGAVYAVSLLGLALPLWAFGKMSAVAGIALTGLAASIACLVMLVVLPREVGRGAPPDDMFSQHLRYGRWALGSEIINWIIFNGPIAALPFWFGLSAAANFRIINLLFLPLLQTTSALTVVLLRVFAAPGGESTKPAVVLKYVGLLGVGAAFYSAIAVAGGVRLRIHDIRERLRSQRIVDLVGRCGGHSQCRGLWFLRRIASARAIQPRAHRQCRGHGRDDRLCADRRTMGHRWYFVGSNGGVGHRGAIVRRVRCFWPFRRDRAKVEIAERRARRCN